MLDEEDLRLLKALGFNISETFREVVKYALAGKRDEIKEMLRAEVERRIEKLKEKEKPGPPCPRCGKPLKPKIIALVDEKGKEVSRAPGWGCECGFSMLKEVPKDLKVEDEWNML